MLVLELDLQVKDIILIRYDYRTFEVTQVHQNLGNVGVVTYSMGGNVPSGEIPGSFDSTLSAAVLVRERDFPQFSVELQPNTFNTQRNINFRN